MAQKEKKPAVQDKDSASSEIARRFRQNPGIFIGTVIVLVLVIVSFVLVPALVPESTKGGGDLVFGYYDKVPVSWVAGNYFSELFERISWQYRMYNIDTNNPDVAEYIWRQAFEGALIHTAILREMKRSSYSVPEKTVNRQVAQRPEFQENGRFSTALYKKMSDTKRLALWRQVRDDMIKRVYYDDLFALQIPSGEAEFFAKMASDMRKFEVVSFQVDNYPDSEYLAFARENADLFRTIHLSRITVNSSEREAKKILDSIKNGSATFEDAARAQSQDGYADRGGDMGIRYVYELEYEIPDAKDIESIFALGKGELSGIIRIDTSWMFFRVEDALASANFDDETVLERVRSYVKSIARGRMEDWAIEQAKEFIADAEASGFYNAASWRNLAVHDFGPLSINYGNVDLFATLESFTIEGISGQEVSNLSKNENFWKTAFSAKLNVPSQPLVQGNRVFVFIPVEFSELDEYEYSLFLSMYPEWQGRTSEMTLQPYFVNSPKTDDRFSNRYNSLFRTGN